jgi:peptidoglycan/LPS O-acetylase OafA/YrhL
MLVEFVYGIVISVIITKAKLSKNIYILISAITFATFILMFVFGASNYHGPLNYGLAGMFIVISGLSLERSGLLPRCSWLDKLGDVSYSLYLSHIITIFAINYYIIAPMGINTHGSVAYFALSVVFSVLFSSLIFRFIEVRFIMLGKSLSKYIL